MEKVPDLTNLLPFMVKFGISDDVERSTTVSEATEQERLDLVAVVRSHEDALEVFFADPDVDPMGQTYIDLSALRMAADEAEAAQETVSEELRRQRTAEMMNAIFGKKKR